MTTILSQAFVQLDDVHRHRRVWNNPIHEMKCSICQEDKAKDEFSKTQRKKQRAAPKCCLCVSKLPLRATSVSQSKSEKTSGCQVKHVQKQYGHLYEIPLEAYAEADVASNWTDWVSEEDVQRASDSWDARSIAHEIDTQWGSMPWGGAYSDSNEYFGPGMYDFY